jgi:putative salt-induced outer membrane protein YdiY
MSKKARSILTLCFLVLSSVPVSADQVLLKNGDRLSGRVVEQDDERVVLETDYAGTLNIVASHVERVTRASSAAARPGPGAEQKLAAAGDSAAVSKGYASEWFSGIAKGWKGDASVGFSYTAGNSENTTMTTGMRAVKDGGADKLSVYARSLWNNNRKLAANGTTSNAFWGGARYDRGFDRKFFGFGSYDFESDRPKKLNFRSVAGAGIGRHAVKTEKTELDVIAGGAWNHTWQVGKNTDAPEALVGNTLKHRFTDRLKLQSGFTFYQNITDIREFRYILDTTLAVDVTKKIGWFVTFGNRFNNDPVGTAEKNDFLFTTGIRWNYGRKK